MKKKTKRTKKTKSHRPALKKSWPGLKDKSRVARIATRAVKDSQSARERTLNSDEYTERLDAALSAAERELRPLMPALTPYEVAEAFEHHFGTHLIAELENIAAHGHRNEDANDVPQAPEPTSGDWFIYESENETEQGRYVLNQERVLIADCYADTHLEFDIPNKAAYQSNARLIAQAPRLRDFVTLIANMKTEDEFAVNPDSEDWITTLNDLIEQAREISGIAPNHKSEE